MSDTRITVTGVDGRDYRITHEAEGPEGWYIEWKSDERGHKYVGHWLIGGAAALLAEVVALRARVGGLTATPMAKQLAVGAAPPAAAEPGTMGWPRRSV